MVTQKVFKQRVRTRMAKTGESYTTARHQLLRKATEPAVSPPEPDAPMVAPSAEAAALPTSDDAVRRATGRDYADWFGLLDGWGATDHSHTEIARWLVGEHGIDGWWSQSVTVAYERARGMRAVHQMPGGFEVAVTRTVGVDADRLLAAFTSSAIRERWLPGVELRQRPTKAAGGARFDWSEPPSRVVVAVAPKGDRKATVAVQHAKLPDAETADRLKVAWRTWLTDLKAVLEGERPGPG